MQTPEFEQSLDELVQLANQERIVLMCAEAVPWRCHRSLIADALLVRGISTEDIMGATRRQVHTLTPLPKSEAPRSLIRPRLRRARKGNRLPNAPDPARRFVMLARMTPFWMTFVHSDSLVADTDGKPFSSRAT